MIPQMIPQMIHRILRLRWLPSPKLLLPESRAASTLCKRVNLTAVHSKTVRSGLRGLMPLALRMVLLMLPTAMAQVKYRRLFPHLLTGPKTRATTFHLLTGCMRNSAPQEPQPPQNLSHLPLHNLMRLRHLRLR